MKIPNDTGTPYRLKKFVEYQHAVPPIHPVTLLAYAKRHKLKEDDIVYLAWLISVTYCEVTAAFLFERLPWNEYSARDVERFWDTKKSELIFNSARRYAKSMDWFVPLMNSFTALTKRRPAAWLRARTGADPLVNYNRVFEAIKEVQFVGRFAADLFLEMLMWSYRHRLLFIPFAEPEKIDWRADSNITSGLMNVMYYDDAADEFDRSGKVSADLFPVLDEGILNVQTAIRKTYPKQESSLPLVQTKLCSFRNLFKGSRYGGYHHDRQLENILGYRTNFRKEKLWDELLEIRRAEFIPTLLGELGGWTGIRKERKKLWLTQGLTGVEEL